MVSTLPTLSTLSSLPSATQPFLLFCFSSQKSFTKPDLLHQHPVIFSSASSPYSPPYYPCSLPSLFPLLGCSLSRHPDHCPQSPSSTVPRVGRDGYIYTRVGMGVTHYTHTSLNQHEDRESLKNFSVPRLILFLYIIICHSFQPSILTLLHEPNLRATSVSPRIVH